MSHNPEGSLQPDRPTLLLTRPQAQSLRFATDFAARFGKDWPIVISPLTKLKFHDTPVDTKNIEHIIFTSQNAVEALIRLSPDRSQMAWCVGEKTGQIVQKAGFATTLGFGSASGLADRIISAGSVRRVLYPRAEDIAYDMKKRLKAAGIETVETIVYGQEPCSTTPEAIRLLNGAVPVLLPLFSRRAAEIFLQNFPRPRAPIFLAAISPAVATAAAAIALENCVIAQTPDSDHMIKALGELLGRNDSA